MSGPSGRRGERLSWSLAPEDAPCPGLLEVVLHGEPLNELGAAALGELEDALAQLPRARAALVRSDLSRGFSAGADLRGLQAELAARGAAAVAPEVRAFLGRINAALGALDRAPIPTAAAVHGVCFGGGLELALTCDLVVAERTARFAFPELRLGLIPCFGGLARLQRDLGGARARDLLLTGRSLGADAAREAGLVGQVVGTGRAAAVARRALTQAAKHPAAAVAAAKARLKPDLAAEVAADVDVFCDLLARPEAEAALASFVAREDALPYLA